MEWLNNRLKHAFVILNRVASLLFFITFIISMCFVKSAFSLERLSVPSNLVAFNSSLGKEIFSRSDKTAFWSLAPFFTTENGLTFCGIASAAMVLNASGLDAPTTPSHAPYRIFDQDNFFTEQVLSIVTPVKVGMRGVSLDELSLALKTFGLQVKSVHGNQVTENEFRRELSAAMQSDEKFVIINFYRKHIGEDGGGHFSPLVAYDKETDRFLLLDVARYKYPSVWVKTADLYKAVKLDSRGVAFDERGYLVVQAN